MDERRIDPRTDPSFSLRNLLRTRAARERYSVAVVGTADGELMAGSQEDRPAWRVVAHAATALFREGSPGDRFEREGLAVLKSASRERSDVSHRDASGLARAARGMLTQRDARVIESLPDIKVPSLVVVGADDTPFLAASDYMAARIPGAAKVVIPAAGHAVNIDQPQAFIDAVLPFLGGLDVRAARAAVS